MRYIRSLSVAGLLAVSALCAPLAANAAGESPMVGGVVTEVRPGGELTIRHENIPNLDMPAMTMVFKLKEPKMGKGLKVGSKIKMHVEDVGGKLTIMHLEKSK